MALLDQSKTDAAMVQLEQEKQVTMVTCMCILHLSTNVLIHIHYNYLFIYVLISRFTSQCQKELMSCCMLAVYRDYVMYHTLPITTHPFHRNNNSRIMDVYANSL